MLIGYYVSKLGGKYWLFRYDRERVVYAQLIGELETAGRLHALVVKEDNYDTTTGHKLKTVEQMSMLGALVGMGRDFTWWL